MPLLPSLPTLIVAFVSSAVIPLFADVPSAAQTASESTTPGVSQGASRGGTSGGTSLGDSPNDSQVEFQGDFQGDPQADSHGDSQGDSQAETAKPPPHALADAQVDPFQTRLLDLAFAAASKLPAKPHIKTRSKLQQDVVSADLELALPSRALADLGKIEDWRRGSCLADLACYYARNGVADRARELVQEAKAIAESKDVGITQDWHKDRILAKAASALAWLGDAEQAAKLSRGLVESETGKVDAVRARLSASNDFEARLADAQKQIDTGHLDLALNALKACVQLYDRFFEQPSLREKAELTIRKGGESTKLPLQMRVDLLVDLAGSAAAHADQATAVRLLDDAGAMHGKQNWMLNDSIPFRARLATLRYKAGDPQRAQLEVEDQFATYLKQRAQIQDFDRCEALLPLAEAFQAMGASAKALAVYRKAIEDGSENPNARTRVEDLVAALNSMAVHALEPDPSLWEAIHKVDAGLKDPW
jgi:tetratricopeptide (TPR) repeat protein